MFYARSCLLALLCAVSPWPVFANPVDAAYTVGVGCDASFGPDGRLLQLDVADINKLPATFVEPAQRQLANARIPPVKDSAVEPAPFRTGMQLNDEGTPGELAVVPSLRKPSNPPERCL